MDRFIVFRQSHTSQTTTDLKSNMDRFIEEPVHPRNLSDQDLKSNMDRFIGMTWNGIVNGIQI